MSEIVRYTGKIRKVETDGYMPIALFVETLKEHFAYSKVEEIVGGYSYDGGWRDMYFDYDMSDSFILDGEDLYEIVEKNSVDICEDVFEAKKMNDGTIDFNVMYYNGGCGFGEAIGFAIENINNKTSKFKVGDRVTCVIKNSFAEVGEIGTVKAVNYISNDCFCSDTIVQWDNNVGGWGHVKLGIPSGHGEYMESDDIV